MIRFLAALCLFYCVLSSSAYADTKSTFGPYLPANIDEWDPFVPLSDSDSKRYEQIFALQADGKLEEAQKLIDEVQNPLLMGHVLYQKYMHPTAYRSKYSELQEWLAQYNDHPGASRLYKLAVARKPAEGAGKLNKPTNQKTLARVEEPTMRASRTYVSTKARSDAQNKAIRSLERQVSRFLSRGQPTRALLETRQDEAFTFMDQVEADTLTARISASYLYEGEPDRAFILTDKIVARSKEKVPLAAWIHGLVSWHKKNYARAAPSFELVANSPFASGWTVAAGSYWAARSHTRAGNVQEVSGWLRKAAEFPRTFYGLIAIRALGQNFEFDWDLPIFRKAQYDILGSDIAGQRAMGLVAAGQMHLAEAELLTLASRADEPMRKALLAYAGYASLPGLAMRLASLMERPDAPGSFYDRALYPAGPWRVDEENVVNTALVNAVIRQESRFDPMAESGSGAVGLMQLMPRTASYVAKNPVYQKDRGDTLLMDPKTNIAIGKTYMEQLLESESIDNDLFKLLIAYNAGPGNLRRWKKKALRDDDPLFFIETIPVSETRTYVERVLSNYWIYRMREDLSTPTLDEIASGRVADYDLARQAD